MKLSIITIGQSPREDFNEYLKSEKALDVNQIGVFDKYENEVPPVITDDILVSKMRNGDQIKIDKSFAVEQVKEIVNEINKDASTNMILLACTGEFDDIESQIPIVYPDRLISNVIQSIFNNAMTLGVLVPDRKQKNFIKKKWDKTSVKTEVFEISPYRYNENDIERISEFINLSKIDYVICDCIGYNREFKNKLKSKTNKQIILSNEIVFNNIFSVLS